MFTEVSKSRAFESVVSQIEDAIYDGTLKPGDYLPSERALVEEFGVGRSSVREALRILESMGLVKTSPGSRQGPQISVSVAGSLSKMLKSAVRVEDIALVDLIEYRMMTGGVAIYMAAHLRTAEHLEEMRAALTEMREISPADSKGFVRADSRFHEVIRSAAGNALMSIIYGVIEEAIFQLLESAIEAPNSSKTRAEFISAHEEFLDAIEQKNAEKGALLVRRSLVQAYGKFVSSTERERLELLAVGPL